MLSWQSALTCVPCQSRNPSRLTRVTRATQLTQTLGSRLPHCFLLVVSLIFSQCHLKISVCILPRVCSPHSACCTQPVFYSQSAVCILPLVRSPQSAVRSLRFTPTGFPMTLTSDAFLNQTSHELHRTILLAALFHLVHQVEKTVKNITR